MIHVTDIVICKIISR